MGNILVFVPEAFADFEITLALHLLKGRGERNIVTFGYTREPVTAQSGVHYTADITLAQAMALPEPEAVILPGGPICEENEALSAFLQARHKQGTLLAAICFGPQYLARAGLLKQRSFTTSCSPAHIRKLGVADPFPRGGFTDARVVTDGNLITAQGHAFVDFAFAIAKYLGIRGADLEGLYSTIMNR